jgi:thioredoxin reductase
MRIGIVGAGAAGLAAASVLKIEHDIVVFEQEEKLGGLWNYRDDPEKGALYPTLRTNLPRQLMAFWDFPFENDSPDSTGDDFPGHQTVLNYLTAFTNYKDLDSLIRFDTRVKSIQPPVRLASKWKLVTYRDETEFFDAVVIANGHYDQPRFPEISGIQSFSGTISHSKNYRNPDSFAAKRVMIWGAAASAQDLSREISDIAEQLFWCGKRKPNSMTSQQSNISYHADPVRIDGQSVFLSDQTCIPNVDHIIYCTGYHYAFPFLSDAIINVSNNLVSPLYKDIIHPHYPTLAFIGIPYLIIPFPLFITQATWFAALLSGKHSLPTEEAMEREIVGEIAAFRQQNGKPWHYHRLGDQQGPYMDGLIKDFGGKPVPSLFHELAKSAQLSRQQDPEGFRKLTIKEILSHASQF